MENKRKPGRPKGSKNIKIKIIKDTPKDIPTPTPTPTITPTPVIKTELEELMEWAGNNRPFFFNGGKKDRKDIGRMYRLYNLLTGLNQQPGKCGACNGNIQLWLRKKLF